MASNNQLHHSCSGPGYQCCSHLFDVIVGVYIIKIMVRHRTCGLYFTRCWLVKLQEPTHAISHHITLHPMHYIFIAQHVQHLIPESSKNMIMHNYVLNMINTQLSHAYILNYVCYWGQIKGHIHAVHSCYSMGGLGKHLTAPHNAHSLPTRFMIYNPRCGKYGSISCLPTTIMTS